MKKLISSDRIAILKRKPES